MKENLAYWENQKLYIGVVFVVVMYILQIHIVLNVGRNFVCEVLDLIEELMKWGNVDGK